MTSNIKKYFKKMKPHSGATLELITEYEKQLNTNLPIDYKEFLIFSNGIEGFIGESYLALFQLEDLVKVHKTTKGFAPNLLVIGTDGGGTDYIFDIKEGFIIKKVESIGLGIDNPDFCAANFGEFLNYLFKLKYT